MCYNDGGAYGAGRAAIRQDGAAAERICPGGFVGEGVDASQTNSGYDAAACGGPRLKGALWVLCSVVDNLGDIGFAFRLCRALKEKRAADTIYLAVKGLPSFKKIASAVDDTKAYQEVYGIKVLDWGAYDVCMREALGRPPRLIVQCFQCEYPGWLSDIIFSEKSQMSAHIVSVEYLTAEAWARDFHLLRSPTRSRYVKKTLFMGGFTRETGGLLHGGHFMRLIRDARAAAEEAAWALGEQAPREDAFKVLIFTYDIPLSPIARALKKLSRAKPVTALVAQGAGLPSAARAMREEGVPFEVLPFLDQDAWDAVLCSSDAALVRGEDSMTRALLSGIPFIWNIYPQEKSHHIIKLFAFLNALGIPEVRRLSLLLDSQGAALAPPSEESFSQDIEADAYDILAKEGVFAEGADGALEREAFLFFNATASTSPLRRAFRVAAQRFLDAGDLAENLLELLVKCESEL